MSDLTAYDFLGLKPTATPEEIKRAYRHATKIYHPDSAASNGGNTAMFNRVKEAYEILIDPEHRRRYDSLINETIPPREPEPPTRSQQTGPVRSTQGTGDPVKETTRRAYRREEMKWRLIKWGAGLFFVYLLLSRVVAEIHGYLAGLLH
jgi:DnaJ-class molecular chaperone